MTVRVGLSETVLLFEQTISVRLFQSGGLPASIHHAGAFKGSGRTDHPNGGRRENVVSACDAAEASCQKQTLLFALCVMQCGPCCAPLSERQPTNQRPKNPFRRGCRKEN
jgi:hypothetical protein